MQTLNLVQGTPEWHAHRANHFNASDAPAMMGCSSYKTRTQLLDEMVTGITPDVDEATQRRFDDGHRFEALARPYAETVIGSELYPVTGKNGKLSASFDGLTMLEDVLFEHKSLNDRIRAATSAAELPLEYRVQVEQQFMVCDTAKRCLFIASSYAKDGTLIDRREFWIEPDLELRALIIAGWAQLESDLANHAPATKPAAAVTGKAPDSLPALLIEVTGAVTSSNLVAYKDTAIAVFKGIKTDLQTDEDFATAEATARWCKGVEDGVESAKERALSQTASIDELFRALDQIKNEARETRLKLERSVKSEKERKKLEIVQAAIKALGEHCQTLNAQIGEQLVPLVVAGFGEAAKNKRTLASLQEAVNQALADAKVQANLTAERIEANQAVLTVSGESLRHLFPDFPSLCTTDTKLFAALVEQRATTHRQEIAAKAAEAVEAAAKLAVKATASNVVPVEFAGTPEPAKTPAETVVAAEDAISSFLNSREWAKGKANEYRAVLVEFVKHQAKFAAAA